MQLTTYNLIAPTKRRRPSPLVICLLVLNIAAPLIARPASVSEVTSLDSFKVLMLTIANLNRAMRSAAQNPEDDGRRRDAANAYAMMPAAIVGLAGDFKAGKLGNEDLPMVQAMLGGFIDKNAADNFKQFIKSPNKNLIPQVSPQLAAYLPKTAGPSGSNAVVAAGPGGAVATNGKVQSADLPGNSQVLSLSDPALMATASGGGKDKSQSISYDESAKQNVAASGNVASSGADAASAAAGLELSGGIVGNKATSSSGAAASGNGDAISDLRQLEVKMVAAVPAKSELDKDFLTKTKVGGDGEAKEDIAEQVKNLKKGSRRPASAPHAELAPKYFTLRPIVIFAESLLIAEAHAENNGGNGGNSDGSGRKDGGEAAAMMMALAQVMAAGAPIAIASIQANADKYIAKTNADAQINMTNITSNTSKYLANQQKDIALRQADIAQSVNKSNNDFVTQRLQMQLGELSNARHEAEAAEQQKLAIEQQYNQQRIALAQQQADQNVKLAQQTLNAQLTQLGLSSGAVNSRNSANRLTTSSIFGAPSSAGAGVSLGAGSSAGGLPTQGLVAPGESARGLASGKSEGSFSNTSVDLGNAGESIGQRGAVEGSASGVTSAFAGAPSASSGSTAVSGAIANAPTGQFAKRDASFSASGASASSDGIGAAMRDLASAGNPDELSATPGAVQSLSQQELHQPNNALLASVHNGSQRSLGARGAAVGESVFDSANTVAQTRGGNRGAVQGATRSRLAPNNRASGYSPLEASRILDYLRAASTNHLVNGSTPTERLRIAQAGSDLGAFTRAAVPESQSENFVQFRSDRAEKEDAFSGVPRTPSANSGHKRR